MCVSLILRRFVYADHCVQTAGVANVGKTVEHHALQKLPAVSDPHITAGVGSKLRFTSALRQKKTECDHFTLFKVQPAARIIIAKTVGGNPTVYRLLFVGEPLAVPVGKKL